VDSATVAAEVVERAARITRERIAPRAARQHDNARGDRHDMRLTRRGLLAGGMALTLGVALRAGAAAAPKPLVTVHKSPT